MFKNNKIKLEQIFYPKLTIFIFPFSLSNSISGVGLSLFFFLFLSLSLIVYVSLSFCLSLIESLSLISPSFFLTESPVSLSETLSLFLSPSQNLLLPVSLISSLPLLVPLSLNLSPFPGFPLWDILMWLCNSKTICASEPLCHDSWVWDSLWLVCAWDSVVPCLWNCLCNSVCLWVPLCDVWVLRSLSVTVCVCVSQRLCFCVSVWLAHFSWSAVLWLCLSTYHYWKICLRLNWEHFPFIYNKQIYSLSY